MTTIYCPQCGKRPTEEVLGVGAFCCRGDDFRCGCCYGGLHTRPGVGIP